MPVVAIRLIGRKYEGNKSLCQA